MAISFKRDWGCGAHLSCHLNGPFPLLSTCKSLAASAVKPFWSSLSPKNRALSNVDRYIWQHAKVSLLQGDYPMCTYRRSQTQVLADLQFNIMNEEVYWILSLPTSTAAVAVAGQGNQTTRAEGASQTGILQSHTEGQGNHQGKITNKTKKQIKMSKWTHEYPLRLICGICPF